MFFHLFIIKLLFSISSQRMSECWWCTQRLSFLVFFTAIAEQTVNKLVKNPSYAAFNSLQDRYGDTLKCPCSVIAIEYRTFVTMEPKFHQVQQLDQFSHAIEWYLRGKQLALWLSSCRRLRMYFSHLFLLLCMILFLENSICKIQK